jgi:hypothetical protein
LSSKDLKRSCGDNVVLAWVEARFKEGKKGLDEEELGASEEGKTDILDHVADLEWT